MALCEIIPIIQETEREEFAWFIKAARAPRLRTMREFAEAEIILPNGPHEGSRFRVEYQPSSGLWFDCVDSGLWKIYVATGPSQSGKTLSCFVIPVLYHLFEIGETVIAGLPDMDMAADKWYLDLEPVIKRTRYAEFLPIRGAGSRGGKVRSIQFRNGATLRFMSGGGGDKSRAGFTSRVVIITETDGMDESGGGSKEADKIRQLVARTKAYGESARIYMECTLTTKAGRTWREYENGTKSRIVLQCARCGLWVTPGRENLVGWQNAEDEIEAVERSRFACPECGAMWSQAEWVAGNRGARLLHKGQSMSRCGVIWGGVPRTRTCGFRWSAANNLFTTPGEVGLMEWKKPRSEDEEEAEKELCQFIWANPYEPPAMEVIHLTSGGIMSRQTSDQRGEVPSWCRVLSLAIDVGKHACHWSMVAWGDGAKGHVVDYHVIEVPSHDMSPEKAILVALRGFRDEVMALGWGDKHTSPDIVLIDSRYFTKQIREFCAESAKLGGNCPRYFFGTTGYGAIEKRNYEHPKSKGSVVRLIGDNYHMVRVRPEGYLVVNINADHWKNFLHQRLADPVGDGGGMTIFAANERTEHLAFSKHLTAERRIEEFVPDKGMVVRYKQINPNNHWLDSTELCCVGAHLMGVRLNGKRGSDEDSVEVFGSEADEAWGDVIR